MDWATNGMQLLVEITWLQPVNSLGKAFTGTAGEEISLGSFCQKKRDVWRPGPRQHPQAAITVLSYSALLLAEKLEKRAHCPQPQPLLTLPFARHFLNSLSWMKPANI